MSEKKILLIKILFAFLVSAVVGIAIILMDVFFGYNKFIVNVVKFSTLFIVIIASFQIDKILRRNKK